MSSGRTGEERKLAAAFYTKDTSADFLAELQLNQAEGFDWGNVDLIAGSTILDPACGAGALLAALLRGIRRRHVEAGGDGNAISRICVERVLLGWDIFEPALVEARERLLAEVEGPCGDPELILWPFGGDYTGASGKVYVGALEALREPPAGTLPGMWEGVPVHRIGAGGRKTAMHYRGGKRMVAR